MPKKKSFFESLLGTESGLTQKAKKGIQSRTSRVDAAVESAVGKKKKK